MAKIDRVYGNMYDRPGVTADDFAKGMTKFVPVADEMLAYGSEAVVYAFDLMMYIADHVRGDLDSKHASGYGDSQGYYQVMDPKLLQVIDMRVIAEAGQQETMVWKNEALAELVSERDHLEEYGIEGYFLGSIKRLQELTNNDGRGNGRESRSDTGSESQSDSESG